MKSYAISNPSSVYFLVVLDLIPVEIPSVYRLGLHIGSVGWIPSSGISQLVSEANDFWPNFFFLQRDPRVLRISGGESIGAATVVGISHGIPPFLPLLWQRGAVDGGAGGSASIVTGRRWRLGGGGIVRAQVE